MVLTTWRMSVVFPMPGSPVTRYAVFIPEPQIRCGLPAGGVPDRASSADQRGSVTPNVQHATPRSTGMRPPWSPLSITLISLLLPAGGAILTIRNMQRLNAIDSKGARELTFAAIGVFAVGIAVLFIVARRATAASGATGDTGAFLGFGTAMASYIVQQRPFHAWRTANRAAYTSA